MGREDPHPADDPYEVGKSLQESADDWAERKAEERDIGLLRELWDYAHDPKNPLRHIERSALFKAMYRHKIVLTSLIAVGIGLATEYIAGYPSDFLGYEGSVLSEESSPIASIDSLEDRINPYSR